MKAAFFTIALFLFFQISLFAQLAPTRNISIKTFSADSLHIPLSPQYYIIEDSCASMLRQTRFNHQTKTFRGQFVDVSTTDPTLILGEGNYTQDGLKHGLFKTHYNNGNLRTSGNFNQNEFTGTWQLFYENGDPKLTFTVADGAITFQDAWDEKGNHYVSNGTGNYQVNAAFVTWNGKLVDGKPEGTWKVKDSFNKENAAILSEKFKDGKFVKGNGPLGPYTDASRIIWLDSREFLFLQAENMAVSYIACGEVRKKPDRVVSAEYRYGFQAYSDEIGRHVSAYLENVDLKPYESELMITGYISEEGRLTNLLFKNPFNEKIASGITSALAKVASLTPATVNGERVRQKFEIKFRFYSGLYRYDYRFLPITVQN